MGITVKASANIQLVGIGLVRSVDCEHGARMDRFALARATCQVAKVGMIVVYGYAAKKKTKMSLYSNVSTGIYMLCTCVLAIFFLSTG
jgi:hypothetical protein